MSIFTSIKETFYGTKLSPTEELVMAQKLDQGHYRTLRRVSKGPLSRTIEDRLDWNGRELNGIAKAERIKQAKRDNKVAEFYRFAEWLRTTGAEWHRPATFAECKKEFGCPVNAHTVEGYLVNPNWTDHRENVRLKARFKHGFWGHVQNEAFWIGKGI